jgi:hypothetical protein
MEAPKCRLCGKRHWRDCAVMVPVLELKTIIPKPIVKPVSLTQDLQVSLTKPKPVNPTEISKPKFDRNAYQRELMRKRRAKKNDGEDKV